MTSKKLVSGRRYDVDVNLFPSHLACHHSASTAHQRHSVQVRKNHDRHPTITIPPTLPHVLLPPPHSSGRRIPPHHVPHLPRILLPILPKQRIRLALGRALRIRLVQQTLHPQQNILDRDRRPPPLILVQDGQAHRAGRIDVGVEERRGEFAFRRLGGVFVGECDGQLEQPALPDGALLAGDAAVPELGVEGAVGALGGARVEAERVVFAPLFAGVRVNGGNRRGDLGVGGAYRSSWRRFWQSDILVGRVGWIELGEAGRVEVVAVRGFSLGGCVVLEVLDVAVYLRLERSSVLVRLKIESRGSGEVNNHKTRQ